MTTYRVLDDTSVRASTDPDSPDYDRWLHFAAGQTVTDPPEHADVKGWLRSGHWVETEPKRRKAKES